MDAVTIGFALAMGLIVVVMARWNSRPHRAANDHGGSFTWLGGDSGGSSGCDGDGGGGGCGDGGGGGD
jgi:hypothetical protein